MATSIKGFELTSIQVKTTSFEDAKKATAKAAAQGSVQSMLQTLLETKNNDRPWVLPSNQQCNYKVCGTCRYTFSDRSFLSIDGILKGDVPPTAATGFGFHQLGERPIADANIVKTIGWRPVPWVSTLRLALVHSLLVDAS